MSEPKSERLIVCVGQRVSWICAAAMQRIPSSLCRIVMGEWIDDQTLARASLLWVVDEQVRSRALAPGMQRGIPILTPDSNQDLRRLCVKAKCGLYYSSACEAEAAIRFLLEHEALRKAMGENARAAAARESQSIFRLRSGMRPKV